MGSLRSSIRKENTGRETGVNPEFLPELAAKPEARSASEELGDPLL